MTTSTNRIAEMSADDLVATLHPYGQWSERHTVGAATQIAELVRYLNHATMDRPDEALPDPNTAAAVLGALHTTCTRLPQLLNQVGARLSELSDDPDLATGSSEHPAAHLAHRAVAALATAGPALTELASAVQAAFYAADRLYLNVDDDQDQD